MDLRTADILQNRSASLRENTQDLAATDRFFDKNWTESELKQPLISPQRLIFNYLAVSNRLAG
jgi:hypothetical protein